MPWCHSTKICCWAAFIASSAGPRPITHSVSATEHSAPGGCGLFDFLRFVAHPPTRPDTAGALRGVQLVVQWRAAGVGGLTDPRAAAHEVVRGRRRRAPAVQL